MNDMNKDELKEKVVDYASKVFFYCVKRCNSRMDAEDLSQTILLEIIQNIDNGARIDNLDYYIWGVCKNQYNMYLRKTIKDRNNLEYKEDIDSAYDSKTALDEMLEDEKIRRMNQAIKLLSKDYAEILYAYYVEDKTLKFIAEELNIPLGTAKWKLAEVRKKLKEYLDMEKLNGRKAYVPKSFQAVQSFSGKLDYDPAAFVDSLLVKNLLYHSYGNECSIEDYSIELGISRPYIEEFVNKLENVDFLIKLENGKYLSNVAFIDKKERREILDYGRNNIGKYYNAVVKFAKENLIYYKSFLDDETPLDEHLLWSFIFIIISSIESNFSTGITKRKDGQYWDMLLEETVDKLYDDEFFISMNGSVEKIEGHQMMMYGYPANHWKENCGASDVIAYDRALDGKFNLKVLYDILIKNKKYNEFDVDSKQIIDTYIENGYFDLNDNHIKVNIPTMKVEDYKELNKKIITDKELIDSYKELYNGIYEKVSKLVPTYLVKQIPFIIAAIFNTVRSIVISKAFDDKVVKDDKTRRKFIYNGFILK